MKKNFPTRRYVLDTSAILSFFNQEKGHFFVKKLLTESQDRKVRLYVSFVTVSELHYKLRPIISHPRGMKEYAYFHLLPLEFVWAGEEIANLAGVFKERNDLGLADAYIAATAVWKDAVLVHKDKDFLHITPRVKQKYIG